MENQPKKPILEKTFDEMPFRFSSSQFVKSLMKNGTYSSKPYTYEYFQFLVDNCIREAKKTWRKKYFTSGSITFPSESIGVITLPSESVSTANTENFKEITKPLEPLSDDEKLKQAIAFCKSKGLRVTRITEEEL